MTSEPERYELLVLGSGEAGLAWTMGRAGLHCAVVEHKLIGGSCPNTNCLPTKNEIWSAKVADLVHQARQVRFGSDVQCRRHEESPSPEARYG
jgi:pyruvate/2-oxoglutarate dehydrogenase complex dihydrolipoamide dehydrogenase (E3) component